MKIENKNNTYNQGSITVDEHEKILGSEDTKEFDKIYDYIFNYRLNNLRAELNDFLHNVDLGATPRLTDLSKQIKMLEKSEKFEFDDKERYGKFYKRIMEKMRSVNYEDRKLFIKEELIRLKLESKDDESIELTTNEIEMLIQQIDKIINDDEIEK